ncbi:MAG: UDP-3-O-(3-hydroxymyristoyl)glucosamine N-acyltransferase [Succinivibrionaceae bacterium]
MSLSVKEIAQKIGGKVIGDDSLVVERIANLATAQKGDISFLSDKKMHKYLSSSIATAVIVKEEDVLSDAAMTYIVVPDPYLAFALTAQILDTTPRSAEGIHPTAVVDPTATIAEDVSIGPNAVIESDVFLGKGSQIGANCFIGKGTKIGAYTKLWANVTVYHNCEIGEHCLFQSGSVIGSDGFGYANSRGEWVKIPQLGRVIIGNRVEIGANTCVDRGAVDDTIISDNVIIDNLVQIAHNDKIGYGSAIAGAAVLAGSVELGKYCIVGGTSVMNGHIKICDGVKILGQVPGNITKPGEYTSYLPVAKSSEWSRIRARLYQIEKIYKRLLNVEKLIFSKNKE